MSGIQYAVESLNRFVNLCSDNIPKDKKFIITSTGDVKGNRKLVQQAREMGRQLFMSLKE